MIGMSLGRAADICGGTLSRGDKAQDQLGHIVIDSRKVRAGDLFVAYAGEKVDGHDFIKTALERGAGGCLAQRLPEGVDGPVILVEDVQAALEKLAAAYRRELSIPVVAVTGSVGKTTAKEMTAAVLSSRFVTLRTEGNLNNQIGVPMTLSRIASEHEAAVVELGINGFGQMSQLAAMAQPDIALFTTIGHAHLEFLHDLEGVFQAKTELLDYLSPEGWVVINGDDPWLAKLKSRERCLSCGLSPENDIWADEIRLNTQGSTSFCLHYRGRAMELAVPAFGMHLVYAAMEAAAVGFILGLTDDQIAEGVASYEVVGRRGAVTVTDKLSLVDDSYNANPDSMREAINSLCLLPGRHVCILGDMLELGPDEAELHRQLGQLLREKAVDLVLCTGELCRNMLPELGDTCRHFSTKAELIDSLKTYIRPGDQVLVKASRGIGLEEVAEALKKL